MLSYANKVYGLNQICGGKLVKKGRYLFLRQDKTVGLFTSRYNSGTRMHLGMRDERL